MLKWGIAQLFLEEILWRGGNFPRGQLSSGPIVRGAIFLGGNCPRTGTVMQIIKQQRNDGFNANNKH